jgi:hypothetical protein
MMGAKAGATEAADAGNREAGALHVCRAQLAVARPGGEFAAFGRQLCHALPVGIADDRHHQPARGVGGEADVAVLLHDQRRFIGLQVDRTVERREFLQCRAHRLDDEGQHGQLDARLGLFGVDLLAEGFEIGDVGFFVIGDCRNHHPVARQVCSRKLADAR